jgi:integrase
MHPCDAGQLAAFLAWLREHSELHAAWHVLAYTGMRRGELLALRWRDIDLDAATITLRRSAGLIRVKAEGAKVEKGPAKTGKPCVIDLDPGTVGVLRAWKKDRGGLALVLARDDALVFGDIGGRLRHPSISAGPGGQTVRRAAPDGADVSEIRLHDLRHTHATILQVSAREPVTSSRPGSATPAAL